MGVNINDRDRRENGEGVARGRYRRRNEITIESGR